MENGKHLSELSRPEYTDVVNAVQAAVKENGLEALKYENATEVFLAADEPLRHSVSFNFNGLCKPSQEAQVTKLKADLEKILQPFGPQALKFRVQVGIGEGDKFPEVEGLKTIPDLVDKTFVPPAEVCLVDFWATWCGPCQGPMQHNQEMLEHNKEKWAGKARIVGISLDDDVERLKTRIEEKKWHAIEHYISSGGWGSEAAKKFAISGIPTVMLLDKNGIIVYRGHPSTIKLEDKINELIAGVEQAPVPAPAKAEEGAGGPAGGADGAGSLISYEEEQALIAKVKEKQQATVSELKNAVGSFLVLYIARTYHNNTVKSSGRVIYGGTCTSPDTTAFKAYYQGLLELVPKDFVRMNRLEQTVNPPVVYGTACATCKKALGKGVPHYICTALQKEGNADHAWCEECADVEVSQELKSGKEIKIPYGLLFVTADMEESLGKMRRVFNKADVIGEDHECFENASKRKSALGVGCDGCNQAVGRYRFACASCGNFDLCLECFKITRDPNHEKYKEYEANLLKQKHDIKTHPLYRGHYFLILDQEDAKPVEL